MSQVGAHYIEVLMVDGADPAEQAMRVGRAVITPCLAAMDGMDEPEKLHFWMTLVAFLLGVAESQIDAAGRAVIVECMRQVPASTPAH